MQFKFYLIDKKTQNKDKHISSLEKSGSNQFSRRIGLSVRSFFESANSLISSQGEIISWQVATPVIVVVAAMCWMVKELDANLPADSVPVQIINEETGNGFEDWEFSDKLLVNDDGQSVPDEALQWMKVLESFPDDELQPMQCAKKYQNLSTAAGILSACSDGPIRQRYWSEQAVKHGRKAIDILNESPTGRTSNLANEANTRLLLAMALNHCQEGEITAEAVSGQFSKIDRSYLIRRGFCNNKLLRALDRRKVIELPNYFSEINI